MRNIVAALSIYPGCFPTPPSPLWKFPFFSFQIRFVSLFSAKNSNYVKNIKWTAIFELQPLSLFGLYILQNLVHGKFSINCYSFNFMHESCLKGKMLVDQPPSCHHPLQLPSATPPLQKPPLTLTHQPSKNGTQKGGGGNLRPLLRQQLRYSKTFTAQTEIALHSPPRNPLETFIVLILLTGQAAKAFAHCLPLRHLA